MSLFEKANRGTERKETRADTSLFNKALAAREPRIQPLPVEDFDTGSFAELEAALATIAPNPDSVLQLWPLVSSRLPLSDLALFLPRGDSLALAAKKGFQAGQEGSISLSLLDRKAKAGEALDPSAAGLFAPLLGVERLRPLRSSLVWPESGLFGLWIYSDPGLEASRPETQSRLGELLAQAGLGLPPLSLAETAVEPATLLLESSWRYASVSAFAFDLAPQLAGRWSVEPGNDSPGFAGETIRSAFLAGCGRILSKGGLALAYGASRVGCILGSAPTLEPDLALFQFNKTLRRILPAFAAAPFPEGRALRLDPASETAIEELSRFLAG
jgi:hypothetical protein